jgi:hypothetical protein
MRRAGRGRDRAAVWLVGASLGGVARSAGRRRAARASVGGQPGPIPRLWDALRRQCTNRPLPPPGSATSSSWVRSNPTAAPGSAWRAISQPLPSSFTTIVACAGIACACWRITTRPS